MVLTEVNRIVLKEITCKRIPVIWSVHFAAQDIADELVEYDDKENVDMLDEPEEGLNVNVNMRSCSADQVNRHSMKQTGL